MSLFIKKRCELFTATLLATLLVFLAVPSAAAASEMTDFLDDYEQIVVSYEKFADKPTLCTQDIMVLNAEIMPVLMPLSQKAQTLQAEFTAAELQRYMDVAGRFSQAMLKLSNKMANVSC